MLITLNIATLAHRSGDTIDVDADLAADLVAGGHATFAEPAEPEAVLTPEPPAETTEVTPRRRGGKVDEPAESTPEP